MGGLSPLFVLLNHECNQAMLSAYCPRLPTSSIHSYLCQTCAISFEIDITLPVLHTSIQHLRDTNKLDYIAQLWGWMFRSGRTDSQGAQRSSAKQYRPGDRGKVQKRPGKRRNGVPQTRSSQARERRRYRRRHPEEFPDLDFHQSFGSFLTRKNPVNKTVDREIAGYWRMLTQTPSELQYHIFDIREKYRKTFRRYFKAHVISVHGHVSDGANPNLLMSLLLHLMDAAKEIRSDSAPSPVDDSASISASDDANSSASDNPSGPASDSASDYASTSASDSVSDSTSGSTVVGVNLLERANKRNPRIALLQGTYGAVFGPMAHKCVLKYVRPLANGPKPIVIGTQAANTINDQVRTAKAKGCIVLIAEIVRAADGSVISAAAWKHLVQACREHCLVLVVDEALTAMRCGAPFAYQLPQYAKSGFPDLVLFGKAVRTNGIAIEWRGINMRRLGINHKEGRLETVLGWQERFTALATAQDLLASWGTLILARRDDWTTRAVAVGTLLRDMLRREGITPQLISGLHGLIYIRQEDYNTESPIMVANADTYVRLLPTMDEVMTSRAQLLTKVFGATSIPHRAELAAFLRSNDLELHWCSKCGLAVDEENEKSCDRCVVRQCGVCEPGDHVCPL